MNQPRGVSGGSLRKTQPLTWSTIRQEQGQRQNNLKKIIQQQRKKTTSSYSLGWLKENINDQNTLKSTLASFCRESFFHQSGSGQTNQHPLRRKAELQPCTCHLLGQLIDFEPRSSFLPSWMTGYLSYPSLTASWQKLKVCWQSPEPEGEIPKLSEGVNALCDITEGIFFRMCRHWRGILASNLCFRLRWFMTKMWKLHWK